ncbi:MAG: hypothetical protein JST26_07740 [Bacteroidetes bacterium]|nr:hypothetical protein [Bacteroidota bacterium]
MRKHNVYTGEQHIVTHTNVVMVRVDEEGKSIPVSDIVKKRYETRLKKFGKGLLTPDETLKENETVILN